MILKIAFAQVPADEKIAAMLACVFAILFALTLHEFAHAFAAVKNGDSTPKILGRFSVNPVRHLDPAGTFLLLIVGFGFAKPVPINPNNFKNYRKGIFWTSIAGVLINLILAFLTCLLFLVFASFVAYENFFAMLLIEFFRYFTIYNISLFVFNLIPIPPLDGFNMLFAFVKDRVKLVQFSQKYGMILLIILFIAGGYFVADATIAIATGFEKFWRLIFGGLI